MNCSVKFFVPIVMAGASDGAVPPFLPEPELPPQPASATIRTATAAVRMRLLISGYGCLVTRDGMLWNPGGHRDLEVEGTPPTGGALRPDPAAVVLDYALAHGQADSGARVVTAPVEPVERLEDLPGVLRIHPDSVVLDGEAHQITLTDGADGNARL